MEKSKRKIRGGLKKNRNQQTILNLILKTSIYNV